GARDPEGDRILYSLTSNARYGSVVLDATGGYIYTPGQDFTGTDTFTVAAADPGFHINLLDLFRPPSTAASVVVRQGAAADGSLLQFQFRYGSGAQLWSPAARSSLESAAATLASYIVVDAPVIVTFDVTGEFNPLSSTLATAGSDFISSDPGFLPTVVQNEILTGVDSNGADADGEINWNFAQNWAFGDSVAYGQYDLESVALHELTHTLGFLSYVDAPGANTGRSWTVFDSFLVNADGTKVIGNDYAWKNTYTPNLTGANGGLYFAGADAVAAYGNLVPIYTPGTWAPGSSISHLNDRVFGVSRTLMTAQVGSGRGIRVLSPIELGVLADLGYTVTPQPNGAMLAFIGVFFLRRTRRR
ncbi:MAG: Ig-like domain-containing protein, partial [Mycobacterium sp.]